MKLKVQKIIGVSVIIIGVALIPITRIVFVKIFLDNFEDDTWLSVAYSWGLLIFSLWVGMAVMYLGSRILGEKD